MTNYLLHNITWTKDLQSIIRIITLLGFGLLLITNTTLGQMASNNYRLSSGIWTSGGGLSSSSEMTISGTVPITDGQLIFADNRACYTGHIGISLDHGGILLAFYTKQLIDTVEISDKLLKISYGGGVGDLTGKIFYRPGGAVVYKTKNLFLAEGDTIRSQLLPDDLGGIRGLEYYFQLIRGTDTVLLADNDSPYVWVNHFTNEIGQTSQLTHTASYRMVGLPIEIEGSRQVSSVFEDDLGQASPDKWRLGSHTSTTTNNNLIVEFPDCAQANPGQGYWLITKEPESFGAAGYSVRPVIFHDGLAYYPISIDFGWNQIANPFNFTINFRDVIYERNGIIGKTDTTKSIFWYAGAGYSTPKYMNPWSGYFYFHPNQTSLRLLIPYLEIGLPNNSKLTSISSKVNKLDWSIGICINVEDRTSETCFAGSSSLASYNIDSYDKPMPPAPPGIPVCGFIIKHNNPFLWQVDAHEPVDSISVWELKFGLEPERQLTLEGIEQLPKNLDVLLILDMGTQIRIASDRSVKLPNDCHSAQLIVGQLEKISIASHNALPNNFALRQNFPNPFNPNTTLRFALPESEQVSLMIYNLLGQQVRQLINQQMTAGVHSIVWDGCLADGQRAASGIYLYRLTTSKYTATKKMVLLK